MAVRAKYCVFRTLSHIFAATAALFFIAAFFVAMSGVSEVLDLSNLLAIVMLCFAFIFSVLGAIISVVYRIKRKLMFD